MKFLIKKYRSLTYFAILGLVIGSLFTLFYNFEIVSYYNNHGIKNYEWVIGFVLLLGGIFLSLYLIHLSKKIKANHEQNSQTAENNETR